MPTSIAAPDVSIAPPKIPESGFSPFRLQGRYVRRCLPVVFVASHGLLPPFVHIAACISASVCAEGCGALVHLRSSGTCRFTPGALAPVRVVLSRSLIAYRPHPPHWWAHPDFTALRLIRDALAVHFCLGDPPLVPRFRRLFSIDMSSSATTGSSSAAGTQFLCR
jgi:hypothetical protein